MASFYGRSVRHIDVGGTYADPARPLPTLAPFGRDR
jgi:hypothetical protein